MRYFLLAAFAWAATFANATSPAFAAEGPPVKIGWVVYTPWMPWGYAQQSGILKKWADKYQVNIELVQLNDYVESVSQYTSGGLDGVMASIADIYTLPIAAGVESTAFPIDFSNGADAVVLKGKNSLSDIKGQTVHLVQYSVSHYLLDRALEKAHLNENDVSLVNTSDADFVAAYQSPDVTALVSWNPQTQQILQSGTASVVFDSSQIPGEIFESLVLRTSKVQENPNIARALLGAWFETVGILQQSSPHRAEAISALATASGTDAANYEEQLKSVQIFASPNEVRDFVGRPELAETLKKVGQFAETNKLLGSKGFGDIGVSLPDQTIIGSPDSVLLHFDGALLAETAAGKP
jgi:NitT/TauT family transport system substrate-binding protein